LWHPVLVAEQIGTLAAITQGPFIMQCGLGWGEARFTAMGANIRTRPSAFEEALEIVRRLLAGETVSSSRRFRVAEASLALRPAESVPGCSSSIGPGRSLLLVMLVMLSTAFLLRQRSTNVIRRTGNFETLEIFEHCPNPGITVVDTLA